MTTERAPAVSPETADQRLHQDLLVQAPGAAEALVHRYGVKIYRLALRILREIADLTGYVTVLKKIPLLSPCRSALDLHVATAVSPHHRMASLVEFVVFRVPSSRP